AEQEGPRPQLQPRRGQPDRVADDAAADGARLVADGRGLPRGRCHRGLNHRDTETQRRQKRQKRERKEQAVQRTILFVLFFFRFCLLCVLCVSVVQTHFFAAGTSMPPTRARSRTPNLSACFGVIVKTTTTCSPPGPAIR